MNNSRNRSSLLGVVGAYLIYLAYQLFDSRLDPDTTMTPTMRIIFIALFTLSGVALIVYAVRIWRRGEKENQEEQGDDINAIK